jgi:hypothetical protein
MAFVSKLSNTCEIWALSRRSNNHINPHAAPSTKEIAALSGHSIDTTSIEDSPPVKMGKLHCVRKRQNFPT